MPPKRKPRKVPVVQSAKPIDKASREQNAGPSGERSREPSRGPSPPAETQKRFQEAMEEADGDSSASSVGHLVIEEGNEASALDQVDGHDASVHDEENEIDLDLPHEPNQVSAQVATGTDSINQENMSQRTGGYISPREGSRDEQVSPSPTPSASRDGQLPPEVVRSPSTTPSTSQPAPSGRKKRRKKREVKKDQWDEAACNHVKFKSSDNGVIMYSIPETDAAIGPESALLVRNGICEALERDDSYSTQSTLGFRHLTPNRISYMPKERMADMEVVTCVFGTDVDPILMDRPTEEYIRQLQHFHNCSTRNDSTEDEVEEPTGNDESD